MPEKQLLSLDQGARLGIAMPPSERFFRMALANLPRDPSGVVLPNLVLSVNEQHT
jgi:hypothetical protein